MSVSRYHCCEGGQKGAKFGQSRAIRAVCRAFGSDFHRLLVFSFLFPQPLSEERHHPCSPRLHQSVTKSFETLEADMKRSKLPLLAALFLTIPSLPQQNPAPPIYPSPGNPADAQSQQNVSAQENS